MEEDDFRGALRLLIEIRKYGTGDYSSADVEDDVLTREAYQLLLKDIAADALRIHYEFEPAQAAIVAMAEKFRTDPEFADDPVIIEGFLFSRFESDVKDAIDGLTGRSGLVQEWAVLTSYIPRWLKIIFWLIFVVVGFIGLFVIVVVFQIFGSVLFAVLTGGAGS